MVDIAFVDTLQAVIKFVLKVLDIETAPPKVVFPVTVRVLLSVVTPVTFTAAREVAPVAVRPNKLVPPVTVRLARLVVPALRVLILAVTAPSKIVLTLLR